MTCRAFLAIVVAVAGLVALDARATSVEDRPEGATPSDPGAARATPALPGPLAAGWKGRPVCEALVDDARQRVLRCTFPPGVGHERHVHAPHAGYVLDGGTMRIQDAGGARDVSLTAGRTWTSAGGAWHEVLNVGETTVRVVLFEPKGGGS